MKAFPEEPPCLGISDTPCGYDFCALRLTVRRTTLYLLTLRQVDGDDLIKIIIRQLD